MPHKNEGVCDASQEALSVKIIEIKRQEIFILYQNAQEIAFFFRLNIFHVLSLIPSSPF